MSLLEVENLSVEFGAFRAVDQLDLEVGAGEIFALVGANGAGKSSTIMAIVGHVEVFGGRIVFDGEDITSLIRRAEGTTPIPQPGGNLAYVVHGDDVLGVDIATGLPTDLYTVITKSDGTLVTAFPGLPTGGR